MTLSVIVADDHPIFRDGLVASIEETGEFSVVGTGASAEEAIALADKHRPDIALLDLSMPGNGIAAVRQIAAAATAAHIAMLTVSENDLDVAAALQAGAASYVLKGVSASELRAILHQIARGEPHITPGLATEVRRILQKRSANTDPMDELSKREDDILKRVARGLSNREIGDELNIQEKTVKHYMTSILSKLHARNRVEAALIAKEVWREK